MDMFKFVMSSQKKNIKAFQVLFELFYEDAYRSAYLITRNQQQARDAVQDAFLKAFKRLDNFQEPKKFGAWISSIAALNALDLLRREKYIVPVGEPEELGQAVPLIFSGFPLPEQDAERGELRSRVREMVASLKPAHQQVLVLKFFHDLDDLEIAEMMEIPVGTVKSRLNRSLAQVGRKLMPQLDETHKQ
ncbi:hypothetical protein SY88_14130 [Clostridiales bacterium PH28_bin88]|nr:hypothetical protein SY88_14130 [Clostridiales bacterium PH28_bin88]